MTFQITYALELSSFMNKTFWSLVVTKKSHVPSHANSFAGLFIYFAVKQVEIKLAHQQLQADKDSEDILQSEMYSMYRQGFVIFHVSLEMLLGNTIQ